MTVIYWSRARRQSAALSNGSLDKLEEQERMGRDAAARWLEKNATKRKFSKKREVRK